MKLRKHSPCNSQLALPAGSCLSFPEQGLRRARHHRSVLITNRSAASCSADRHCSAALRDRHLEEQPNSHIATCLHIAVHFHFFTIHWDSSQHLVLQELTQVYECFSDHMKKPSSFLTYR